MDEDGKHEKEEMAESFENTSYLITFIVIKIAERQNSPLCWRNLKTVDMS